MDPAARGLNEHLDLQECSLEEYNESLEFVTRKDAIMDSDVFIHLKKITSYLFNQLLPYNSNRSDFAATRTLNREALNMLVEGYEGYAWLCQAAAEIFHSLDEFEKTIATNFNDPNEPHNIIYKGLCEQLSLNYDTLTMRRFMDQQRDHGSWNPPDFYWQLMKNPTIVSQMLKLYHEKPKDEFLSSWFQDYIHQSRMQTVAPPDLLTTEELSKLTSNFNVFTLRMSEEISKYLFKDVRTEFDEPNPDNICQLFCYAENAYFYSQALLHFIVRWRPDFSGCRRLSQLLCKNVMNPPSYWTDINKREKEYSASQINLLMTNLSKYRKLNNLFKSISRTQIDGRIILQNDEVCEFYDTLKVIIDSFDSYRTLLYEREEDSTFKRSAQTKSLLKHEIYKNSDLSQEAIHRSSPEHLSTENIEILEDDDNIVDLPSASQYGGDNPYWQEEYKRMRTAPELPPMEALRESSLLERILEDFVDERILLSHNQAWIKYTELLILLTIYTPYEMLLKSEEEKQMKKAAKYSYHGFWKYDFFDNESESSDKESDISYENEESEGHEILDTLFEKPEHHVPGSTFRDPTIFWKQNDLNYYNYPESTTTLKHHLNNTKTSTSKRRRRWDAQSQAQSTSQNQNSQYCDSEHYDPLEGSILTPIESECLSSLESMSLSINSDSNVISDSNSESISLGQKRKIHSNRAHEDSIRIEEQSSTTQELNEDSLRHSSQDNAAHLPKIYHTNFGSGKTAPWQSMNASTNLYDFSGLASMVGPEQENIDDLESQGSPSTLVATSSISENQSLGFLPSHRLGRGKISPLKLNGYHQQGYEHDHEFSGKWASKYFINNDEEDRTQSLPNLNPSVIVSSIYKDELSGKKLGVKKSLSTRKIQRLEELFNTFKSEHTHYSNIARKELFEIYKITRDRYQNINVKIYNFQFLLKTNIAASAAIKYIDYYLFQISPDPLAALSDPILLLLKMIADYHSPQIIAILVLLKKNFEAGYDTQETFNNLHSSKRNKIINFFIYLCRFENEYISVMSVVNKLVDKMDKSMIRAFLILLLKHCGPPYSSEFCRPLFNFLKRCLKLAIFDNAHKESNLEQIRLRRAILQFLDDAKHADQPQITPSDIIASVDEISHSISTKSI